MNPHILLVVMSTHVRLGLLAICLAIGAPPPDAIAQRDWLDGNVTVMLDALPNAGQAVELRTRVFVERAFRGERLRVRLSGWAESLLADRNGFERDVKALPHEAYIDFSAGVFELRAGLATISWGRLDEVQPSDVVNPLDVSRYLFEGRSEARLPVPLTRVRAFLGEKASMEAVWVPIFRGGRFDQLDEPSSPFNPRPPQNGCGPNGSCSNVTLVRRRPSRRLENSQGGVRFEATTRRVDWSIAAYRGLSAFPIPEVSIDPRRGVLVSEIFPRFTLLAGDFETAGTEWAFRGEVAVFVDETLVDPASGIVSDGRRQQAGLGADRKAGSYRFNASLLLQHREAETFADKDVSVVAGAERAFARDTRRLRFFGVWNTTDASAFARLIGSWSLRDDLWLEGSVGWFAGSGDDYLFRLSNRDFVYVKLRAHF